MVASEHARFKWKVALQTRDRRQAAHLLREPVELVLITRISVPSIQVAPIGAIERVAFQMQSILRPGEFGSLLEAFQISQQTGTEGSPACR